MIVTLRCRFCGKKFQEEVTEEQIAMYESGEYHIQDCFPQMKPEIREILISGMCPDCWEKAFSFMDEY